jgi:hypothetical protein
VPGPGAGERVRAHVDIDPARENLAAALGVGFAPPEAALRECDLVVHASGSPFGLATELGLAGAPECP